MTYYLKSIQNKEETYLKADWIRLVYLSPSHLPKRKLLKERDWASVTFKKIKTLAIARYFHQSFEPIVLAYRITLRNSYFLFLDQKAQPVTSNSFGKIYHETEEARLEIENNEYLQNEGAAIQSFEVPFTLSTVYTERIEKYISTKSKNWTSYEDLEIGAF